MIKKLLGHRSYLLLELMIVVAIIGILAAVSLPQSPRDGALQAIDRATDLVMPRAEAAVTNVAAGGAQVVYLPFHFSGVISATATGIAKFNMPMPCDLIGVAASSRAIVGTTNTIDVKLGGVSVLSAPITIAAAGTYTEGTITTSAITDEGVITIDLTIVGTSLADTTVLLTCVRK